MRPLKTLKSVYEEEGSVVITEKKSPPRVIFSGEDFLLEDLPVDTRVIFPRPPLAPVPNVKAAIRWAVNHPEGMERVHPFGVVERPPDRRLHVGDALERGPREDHPGAQGQVLEEEVLTGEDHPGRRALLRDHDVRLFVV